MPRKKNLSEDIFPCADCVFIVQRKYSKHTMEISDSMDELLIYKDGEVVKRERVRRMTAGCRHCKGYFIHQMSLLSPEQKNVKGWNF